MPIRFLRYLPNSAFEGVVEICFGYNSFYYIIKTTFFKEEIKYFKICIFYTNGEMYFGFCT